VETFDCYLVFAGSGKIPAPAGKVREIVNGKCYGGWWNKLAGYWELPYREIVSSGLENRISLKIDKIVVIFRCYVENYRITCYKS